MCIRDRLRHRGLRKRVEQLRAVADDAAVFLRRSRQESGDVLERHERDVEGVAEPDEARTLDRGIDIERARQVRRLIRHDTNRAAAKPRKPDQEIAREVLVHLEEVPVSYTHLTLPTSD